MRLIKFVAAALIAPAALLAASSAGASVVYTYTGNNFDTVFTSGYTTADKITGTLTLSSALPSGLGILTNEAALVTAYSFSDGVFAYSNGCCNSGAQTIFDFTTDASGAITGWKVVLETNDNTTADMTIQSGPSGFDQSLRNGALGGSNSNPGTWQVGTSGVPEPATWTLLIVGIGSIGWMLRRSRKPSYAAVLG